MLRSTLDSTLRAASHRGVWLPSVVGTLALSSALRLFGWPSTRFLSLNPVAIGLIVSLLCASYWLSISVMATALSALRGGSDSIFENWVEPARAARAALLTAMAAVAVAAGSIAIVPGIYLGVMWAPITMIVLDGRTVSAPANSQLIERDSTLLEPFELSSLLTQGARADILAMFVILGFLFGGVELIDAGLTRVTNGTSATAFAALIHLALRAAFDALGLCLMAALYFELEARAFVDTEIERPHANLEAATPAGDDASAVPSAWDDSSAHR